MNDIRSSVGKTSLIKKNHPIRRNNFMFGILMLLLQMAICIIYGLLI